MNLEKVFRNLNQFTLAELRCMTHSVCFIDIVFIIATTWNVVTFACTRNTSPWSILCIGIFEAQNMLIRGIGTQYSSFVTVKVFTTVILWRLCNQI